jgi:hypothetical protein
VRDEGGLEKERRKREGLAGVGPGLWEGRTEEVMGRLTVWEDVDGMAVRDMVCRRIGSWLERRSISQSRGLNS